MNCGPVYGLSYDECLLSFCSPCEIANMPSRKVKLRLSSPFYSPIEYSYSRYLLSKAAMSAAQGSTPDNVCQDRHEKLWLADGNIVLASDHTDTPEKQGKILFRVHKSVLAMNSPIFKDMFEVVSDGTANGESHNEIYEGVPYAFIPDPAEHLEALLLLMYGDSW